MQVIVWNGILYFNDTNNNLIIFDNDSHHSISRRKRLTITRGCSIPSPQCNQHHVPIERKNKTEYFFTATRRTFPSPIDTIHQQETSQITFSDGSANCGIGSCGIILTDSSMQVKNITINERVYGNPGTMSPFRAEAGGTHHTLQLQKDLPHSIYFDNKSVLNAIQATEPLHPLTP